jgi:hypothetical protein
LTARLEKTILSEKMTEENLSRVEESAAKSTYRLSVGFERCEDKGQKSAPKFIPNSTYHKEEATIKPTKAHYPSNLKPSFNSKREARKESSRLREEAFICMFCGRAGHLDVFCFWHKRIERRRVEYARNSYRDEFMDFPPCSYSHVPPRFYSRALPHTSSHAFTQFSYGSNHHSYGFGSRGNCFEPRCFSCGPHHHRGDRFPHRPSFSTGVSYTQFEPRHLDGPRFCCRGSRPTRSNGEVQRTVKTFLVAWLSARFLRFMSLTPSLSHRPFLVLCR